MITVLFAKKNSLYHNYENLDIYDINRDARNFNNSNVVIAHPPCSQWGKLKGQAKYDLEEKLFALHAIRIVRQNGGIIEHPASSDLFKYYLPKPGFIDNYGGFTVCVNLSWFGFPAEKKTLLYIKGISEKQLPEIPYSLDAVQYRIGNSLYGKKELPRKLREETPKLMCDFLIQTALIIQKKLYK